ncbi:MAG: hypothetical protein HC904_12510 [Blastochloris sp.]|nr:hypothetical protein [Blastochloris sp.]
MRDVVSAHGTWVQRATTKVYATNGSSSKTTVSISEQSVDGLKSWQTDVLGNLTSAVQTVPSSGDWTLSQTNPDVCSLGSLEIRESSLESLTISTFLKP